MKKKFIVTILAALQMFMLMPATAWAKENDSQLLYRYYYFLCEGCGDHNPFSSACGCGSRKNSWHETWSVIPYSQCNSESISYTEVKRQTFSLGDGQHWYFSSGNLYDTEPGSKDAHGSDSIIIKKKVLQEERGQSISDKVLGGKYWLFSFGATMGTNLPCRFFADGTAEDVNGDIFRWKVKNGMLYLGNTGFQEDGDLFVSVEKYYSGAGEFNEYIYNYLLPCSKEEFDRRYIGSLEEPVEENSGICDENWEFYAKLISWDDNEMKVELINCLGRYENSLNYIFGESEKTLKLDIENCDILLEYAWGDVAETIYDSIDKALAARTDGNGPRVGELLCGQIRLRLYVRGSELETIELLYAA